MSGIPKAPSVAILAASSIDKQPSVRTVDPLGFSSTNSPSSGTEQFGAAVGTTHTRPRMNKPPMTWESGGQQIVQAYMLLIRHSNCIASLQFLLLFVKKRFPWM